MLFTSAMNNANDTEHANDTEDEFNKYEELKEALSSAAVVLQKLWLIEEHVYTAEKARLRAMERIFLVDQRRLKALEQHSVALGELSKALLKFVEAWERNT